MQILVKIANTGGLKSEEHSNSMESSSNEIWDGTRKSSQLPRYLAFASGLENLGEDHVAASDCSYPYKTDHFRIFCSFSGVTSRHKVTIRSLRSFSVLEV